MSIRRVSAVLAACLVLAVTVSGLAGAAPPAAQSKEVIVVNDASLPVPVQEAASVPTVISGQINLAPSTIHGDEIVDVPEGKQLVVEYLTVAGIDWGPSVEEDVAQVRLTDLGAPGAPFVAIPIERNSAGRFAGSELVQWTVDHPFVIRVDLDQHTSENEVEGNDPAIAWSLAWTLSGYLVDA